MQLPNVGVGGRALRFLSAYLSDRVFAVKTGNLLSAVRPLASGLPQGSVLSPILFNVVMAGVVPCWRMAEACLSTTIYADDVCVWATARALPLITRTLTTALSQLSDRLGDVGLSIAGEKSCFIHFQGTRPRKTTVTLFINGKNIPSVQTHRFLGIKIDACYRAKPQVDASIAATKGAASAIRRMAGTRWGGSPSAMLQVHQALVVSRTAYTLPYLHTAAYLRLKLERAHRAGIKVAMGVPLSTPTVQIYAEAPTTPILDIANDRAP